MRNEDYFVDIQKDHFGGNVKIWFIKDDEASNRREYIIIIDGCLTATSFDISSPGPPTENKPLLEMPSRLASIFLEQLTIGARDRGISIKAENILEGKLLAKDQEIEYLKNQLSKFIEKATHIKQ